MDLLRNKLFLFALVMSLALGLAAFVACGDDDDDDDDTATDDDDDDDAADDADDVADDADDVADDDATDCEIGIGYVYDCGFVLADVDGNELSLSEAIAACEGGDTFAQCVSGCGLISSTCDDLEICVNDNCG